MFNNFKYKLNYLKIVEYFYVHLILCLKLMKRF